MSTIIHDNLVLNSRFSAGMGTIGALPQIPAENVVPCTLSSLRAGLNQLEHTTRMRVVQ